MSRSMFCRAFHSHFNVHANRSFIDKLTAEKTGHCNQGACQKRHIQSPRPDIVFRAIEAQQPIERCQGEEHYRESGMTPSCDQPADATHGHQINQTDKSGNPTAKGTHTAEPQAHARPEKITRNQISTVRRDQSNQRSDGKMNQHGMDRMSAEGHATDNGFVIHKVPRFGLLSAAAVLLTACSGPYSALDPAGPSASGAASLWWGMFTWFSLVFIAVISLWWFALRRAPADNDKPIHHNRWIIGGGVLLPLFTIAALLFVSVPTGYRMLPIPSADNVLSINVVGHQWYWEIHYPDTGLRLRNELHIPVGQPVDIHLSTADVLHSFWVPRLAGKLDAVPGRVTILRLQADEPGLYRGQCAEFCGLHHAHMQFVVMAHSLKDFRRWQEGANGD